MDVEAIGMPSLIEASLIVAGSLIVWRACLTTMFYPVRLWDFSKW